MPAEALDRPASLARLDAEVAMLRGELARLLVERDTLEQQTKPFLIARYLTLLGWKELQLFELEVAVRALRRRVELLQAAANRGQRMPWHRLEAQVAAELAEWHAQIEQRAAALAAARRDLAALLSPEESRELRTLYRKLAWQLHPDVAGAASQQARVLWARVVEAWKNADLTELRALALLAADAEPAVSGERLEVARTRLAAACTAVLAQIAAARGEFPLNLAVSLDDPAWVAARLDELEAREPELQEQRGLLERHLEAWREMVIHD